LETEKIQQSLTGSYLSTVLCMFRENAIIEHL